MPARGTFAIDRSVLARTLTGQAGPVVNGLRAAGQRTTNLAKAELTKAGRVDTGRLRNSLRWELRVGSGGNLRVLVGSDLDYALYVHEGTEGPIRPKRAKVLRFKGKGGVFIFRKEVSGIPPTPFLTNALKRLDTRDLDI